MIAKANISKHLLVKAINTSHEGIVIIDAQQSGFPQIYVNQGFERLTGYTSAETVGKKFRYYTYKMQNFKEFYFFTSLTYKLIKYTHTRIK